MFQKKDPLCRLVVGFSSIVFYPFYDIRIEGRERLPRREACVLLPKHQRWQDIPIIALSAPRPLYFIAKYELFRNALSAWFLESLGGIPLNREQPMKSRHSIRAMIQFLKRGKGVVIFPEGTYYVNKMGPGKSGMLRLIVSRLTFPLVPVGIQYEKSHPRTAVRVRFGHPIYPSRNAPPDIILDTIMNQIATLSGL